ncbi:MAG: glycosyltransferase family 2 protein [Thermodesulfovibrionales bacterium]|nr:glycosyltransferase family 2 protein [Thermodesulfovibrionales bacterium]
MSQNPLVSIIVRTKDRPKLLKRALQSIAGQTYRPIEVILVNEGGCDPNLDEVKSFFGDVSLTYEKLEESAGGPRAGNVGIQHARGEYIGFLDDDDALYPEHVAALRDAFAGRDCRVAYSDADAVTLSYDQNHDIVIETADCELPSQDFSSEMLLFENYIPFVSLLFHGELLRTAGGFDESIGDFSEWDLLIRVASESSFRHSPVRTAQITCRRMCDEPAETEPEKEEDCLRVLRKHAERRTAEAVYRYSMIKKQQCHALKEQRRGTCTGKEQSGNSDDSQEHFRRLESERQVCAGLIRDLKTQLGEKNRYIEEIEKSTGWKVLNVYRKTLKLLFAPPSTKRERIYNLLMKSISVAIDSGLGVLSTKVKNTIKRTLARKNIRREQYIVPGIKPDSLTIIDTRVSVVIPTHNAGTDFRYTLEKIKTQKGIRDIEIIVLDSGSLDETERIAERYGAEIIRVDAAAFNHGATRNLGAERASGDFILFISQDAVPVDDTCVYRIVTKMLKDAKIAGASIRQIPRSDADLFTSWQLWFYNTKLLDYTRDKVVDISRKDVDRLSSSETRKLMQLDNVFSCFRKTVFDEFKFLPLPYAEDLDLGMRLIRGGYKLLFLSSAGVIHSHNRDAAYFFRRGYLDAKTLIKKLGIEPHDWNDTGIFSFERFTGYIFSSYQRVISVIHSLPLTGIQQYRVDMLFPLIKNLFFADYRQPVSAGDPSLDMLLKKLWPQNGKVMTHPVSNTMSLNSSILHSSTVSLNISVKVGSMFQREMSVTSPAHSISFLHGQRGLILEIILSIRKN